MTKAKISEYDAVAANNTDVNGVNIAEGCPPSGMNNMGREIMAALKRFETGADGDSLTVGGSLVVSGSVTAANTATLGNVDINGGTVDGVTIGGASAGAGTFTTLTATGNVTLGNAATDTVTITADVASNIIPSADNTYDLGASGSEWRNLYIDGTANIDSLVADTADINGGTIDGTAIGGASAAAGSFTTLGATGDVTIADKIVHSGDTNTAIRFPAADNVAIETGGVERVDFSNTAVVFNETGANVDFRVEGDTNANLLFVDASADAVGIGTSSPSTYSVYAKLAVNNGIVTSTNTNEGGVYIGTTTTGTEIGYISFGRSYNLASAGDTVFSTSAAKPLIFGTTNAERLRIDASGNLLVGTTAQLGPITARGVFSSASNLLALQAGNGNVGAYMTNNSGTGNWQPFSFCNNGTSFSQIGSITCTASATAYTTSSDYRLKENVAPMTGALAKVLELKPCTYTWKEDGSASEGFIAHELQEIAPYAVSGEKDGEEMQGVDYGKITPLLTAALQEAIAEIQSLKARVAELEAK